MAFPPIVDYIADGVLRDLTGSGMAPSSQGRAFQPAGLAQAILGALLQHADLMRAQDVPADPGRCPVP